MTVADSFDPKRGSAESALATLSLHPLLILVSRLLSRSGYGDVHLLGRREAKGRTPEIGHEIVCHALLGGMSATVVVKVIRDVARVRHLDELSGVALRRGADAALLVAPRGLSRSATAALGSYAPRRIDVLDAPEIAHLMKVHRVGVLSSGEVDHAFLQGLEESSQLLLGFIRDKRRRERDAHARARRRRKA